MTTLFSVSGPWKIDVRANQHGAKRIEPSEFWADDDEIASRRGCYIFAIRNKGILPAYVGKATKSFRQEVFTPEKLNKYNEALHIWTHGTPVMFFVETTSRGAAVSKRIGTLEQFLIREAKLANPALLNKHHAGPQEWEINGITVPHRGKKSVGEAAFMQMMDITR